MAGTTAEAVYSEVVRLNAASERLKLATIILDEISPRAVVDYSEEWVDEDHRDFSAASWAYVSERPEGEDRGAPTR